MKKHISFLLSATITLSLCGSAFAVSAIPVPESVPFQEYNNKSTGLVIDKENPYQDPVGEGYMEVPGIKGTPTEDRFVMYEPSTSYMKMQSVYIAAPDSVQNKEQAAQWLNDTGWSTLAEEQSFRIACMYKADGWSEDPADDFDYLEAVRGALRKRVYWNAGNASFYLVGYEEGADLMAYAAMKDPTHYAGLVTFGGSGVSSEHMKEFKNTPINHDGDFPLENVMVSELDARTWMFIDEENASDQVIKANVQYWKDANDIPENALQYSNANADEIYFEPAHDTLELNEHSIGALYVTRYANRDDIYDADMPSIVWNSFLKKAWRFEGFANCALRAYEDPVESGVLKKYNTTVDGWNREYFVYCPEAVKTSGEDVPLVICTHGSGGTGKEMYSRTDWAKVAEESGFIVVFPTGRLQYEEDGNGQANTLWDTKSDKDLRFIDQMFDELQSNYNIDTSRVYSSGHSNGTHMAIFLAVSRPNMITAVGTSAPVFSPGAYDSMIPLAPTDDTNKQTAVMVALGSYDEYADPWDGGADIDGVRSAAVRSYWEDIWNFEGDDYQCYDNGVFKNYIYTKEDGTPVYQYTRVDKNLHAPLPELSYKFYDFMSKYSRDTDGTLLYMGSPIV